MHFSTDCDNLHVATKKHLKRTNRKRHICNQNAITKIQKNTTDFAGQKNRQVPATSSGGDVQRATLMELRTAIEEVRIVQLNICKVFHKICDAERKDGSSKHVYKHARTCLRSAQLAFTLLQKTFMDILVLHVERATQQMAFVVAQKWCSHNAFLITFVRKCAEI